MNIYRAAFDNNKEWFYKLNMNMDQESKNEKMDLEFLPPPHVGIASSFIPVARFVYLYKNTNI
jgi:hypothetical protein